MNERKSLLYMYVSNAHEKVAYWISMFSSEEIGSGLIWVWCHLHPSFAMIFKGLKYKGFTFQVSFTESKNPGI